MRQYISNEKYELIKDELESKNTYVVVDGENVNKVAFLTNNITGQTVKYEIIPGGGSAKTCSFKFNSDGEFQFIKTGYGSYYLKVNDGEWTEYTTSQTVSVVNGDVIELKSNVHQTLNTAVIKFNDNPNSTTAVSWELEGDLLGALYGDIFPPYGCYQMFKGCTGLTKVPNDMFTNFEYAPNNCCYEMFKGCTSLVTAPALPATTLTSNCYYSMFQGCANLTTTPELPATTLTNWCYAYMFEGCKLINYIKCLATTNIDQYVTNYWLSDVSATGTFVKAAGSPFSPGTYGIPSGWTVVNA